MPGEKSTLIERKLKCGDTLLFAHPAPKPGYQIWCIKCDSATTVSYNSGTKAEAKYG